MSTFETVDIPGGLSYGLGLVGFGVLAAQLLWRWRGGMQAVSLLIAVVASAAWELTGLVFCIAPSYWVWLSHQFVDAVRVSTWLGFAVSLLLSGRQQRSTHGKWMSLSVVLSIAGTVILVLCWVLFPIQPAGFRFSPAEGASGGIGVGLVASILGLLATEQLFRNTAESSRWAIKPLCLALGGAFGFDLFLYSDGLLFQRLDHGVWAARGIAQALTIPFIMVSAARNRQWTIDIAISRKAVLHSTSVLLSGVYLLLIAGAGYYVKYLGGTWGSAIQIAFLFAAVLMFVALFSSGTMRSKLRVFVSKHFFSYRYDYREEWLRVTGLLSVAGVGPELYERCIRALAALIESPGGALWLKNGEQMVQSGRWNMGQVTEIESADGRLARFLASTGWIINLTEFTAAPDKYRELEVPEYITNLPTAWLIVPLMSGEGLVGFVVLAQSRTTIEMDWEVLDLLKTAARQAASFLDHIQANEALLEARKFDAFNRMSAFVVHDLKNVVSQLSLMLKNAHRHGHNVEFQRDMLATVEHAVSRMNSLLLQLRSGTTPLARPALVDLSNVARRIKDAKSVQGAGVTLDIVRDVRAIGHEDRLERVIGHLVQNALDATEAGGVVALRIYEEGGFAVAEVSDSGRGMSPEFVRNELFKPFCTTKTEGMGIGMYESSQYIAELGGRIAVDSALGVGTRVKVFLPQRRTSGAQSFEEREVA